MISKLVKKLWEGGCANELTLDPTTLELNQTDFNPETLEKCQDECTARDNCGYFEFRNSKDCEKKCKLFPKSEIGITKANGNPGTSCHAVFSNQRYMYVLQSSNLLILKYFVSFS